MIDSDNQAENCLRHTVEDDKNKLNKSVQSMLDTCSNEHNDRILSNYSINSSSTSEKGNYLISSLN